MSEHSNVIQVEITPRNGTDVIKVKNSSEPFIICIPNSGGSETQKKMENVVPEFSRPDDIVVYHTTFIDSVGVVVTVNIVPSNVTAPLVLLFKYGEQPSLLDYDQIILVKNIPSENGKYDIVYYYMCIFYILGMLFAYILYIWNLTCIYFMYFECYLLEQNTGVSP